MLTDWEKMSSLNREPSIDAKYPVSIHLNKWFKKRRFTCEKLTDDRRRTSSEGKISFCFGKGELRSVDHTAQRSTNVSF